LNGQKSNRQALELRAQARIGDFASSWSMDRATPAARRGRAARCAIEGARLVRRLTCSQDGNADASFKFVKLSLSLSKALILTRFSFTRTGFRFGLKTLYLPALPSAQAEAAAGSSGLK